MHLEYWKSGAMTRKLSGGFLVFVGLATFGDGAWYTWKTRIVGPAQFEIWLGFAVALMGCLVLRAQR